MVRANLRLVTWIARRHVNSRPAAHRPHPGGQYRPHARGREVSTGAAATNSRPTPPGGFARPCSRALVDQGRLIRIPSHMTDEARRVMRMERQLAGELRRAPTEAELADVSACRLPKVRTVLELVREPVSMDAPLGEDGERRSAISSPTTAPCCRSTPPRTSELRRATEEALSQLTPREADGAAPPLRRRHRERAHASRKWAGKYQVTPRAHPPDRSQGAEEARPPRPRPAAREASSKR